MSQPNSSRSDNADIENPTNSAQKPMTDSGYESDTEQCTEPPGRLSGNDVSPDRVSNPPPEPLQKTQITERRIQIPELDGLTQFVGNVDAQTLERFQDVTERLGGPLADYLRRGGRDCRPMAIRLMILGEDFQRARPWIIVLCPQSGTKRAKKFFQKKFARSILEPNYPSQIRFDLAIIDQPPYPLGLINAETSLEVYDEKNTALTLLFGSLIQLQDCSRYATVGGVIKVVDDTDQPVFYGLTSGHIIDQDRLSKSHHEKQSSSSDSEDTSSEHSSTSSLDGEIPSGYSGDEEDIVSDLSSPSVRESAQVRNGIKLSDASFSDPACNHDWGLISCEEASLIPPNLIQENHHAPLSPWDRILGEDQKPNRAVVINSGVLSSVTLSTLPTFMIMPNGKKFVPVYSCSINGTSNVSVGNSGSWIFGENVDTVFGHIVAKDLFGDLLVVPITRTFEDIKEVLQAKTVSFPTPLELTSLSIQRPETQFDDYYTPLHTQSRIPTYLLPTIWVVISAIMFMNMLAFLDITLKTYRIFFVTWLLHPECTGTDAHRCWVPMMTLQREGMHLGILFLAVVTSILGSLFFFFPLMKKYLMRSPHFIGLVIIIVLIDLGYYSLVEKHLIWTQYIPRVT